MQVTIEAQLGLIGGTMGLLTGFSILSGVEIIYHFLRSLLRCSLKQSSGSSCLSKSQKLWWCLLWTRDLKTIWQERIRKRGTFSFIDVRSCIMFALVSLLRVLSWDGQFYHWQQKTYKCLKYIYSYSNWICECDLGMIMDLRWTFHLFLPFFLLWRASPKDGFPYLTIFVGIWYPCEALCLYMYVCISFPETK